MNKRLILSIILILCLIAGISMLASTAYMKSREPLLALIESNKATPNFERNHRAAGKKSRQQADGAAHRRPQPAAGQSATLLADGSWLLIGGEGAAGPSGAAVVANALSGEQTLLANGLQQPRAYHTATMLPDGTILICGGIGRNGRVVNQVELYDAGSGSFELLSANSLTPRAYHTATLLTDGTVLFVG